MAGRVRGGGAGDLCPKKARARSRPLQSSRTCTSAGAATRPLSTPLELALVADPLRAGLFARIPGTPKGPARSECAAMQFVFAQTPLAPAAGRRKKKEGGTEDGGGWSDRGGSLEEERKIWRTTCMQRSTRRRRPRRRSRACRCTPRTVSRVQHSHLYCTV